MSVKCEELLDELTVQVWLLHLHPILTLIIELCMWDGITDKQTDGQTIRLLDAPGSLSGRGIEN